VRVPKLDKRLPTYLDLPTTQTLFAWAEQRAEAGDFQALRDLAMLELFYSTGMRLSELAGLSLGDVDLLSDQAKVRGKRQSGGHKRYEPYLFASAFQEIDNLSVTIRQALTVDDIVGRAFSMSAVSAHLSGPAREQFAQDLSAALHEWSPDGKFVEVAELVAVLARRPSR